MTTAPEKDARLKLRGKVWLFGDDVPTDRIVETRYLFSPMSEALTHVLEGLKPEFPTSVQKGDVVLAGRHFGQSSGRARAPKTLQATGIGGVIAESFARTFLRNCFEIGLPIMECRGISTFASDGETVSADLITGTVVNETRGTTLNCLPGDEFLLDMLRAGGLIELVRKEGENWAETAATKGAKS